jgi:hypothetical protein
MFGNLLQTVLIVKPCGKKNCLSVCWKYQKIWIIQGISFGLVLIYVIVRGGQRDFHPGAADYGCRGLATTRKRFPHIANG